MTSDEISKIAVVVIESLPDHDQKTGEQLSSSVLKYKSWQNPVIEHELIQVKSKLGLLSKLEELLKVSILKNEYYFLHFEIHGFDGGIETSNGDKVVWNELIPLLRKFNTHYKNNLLLVLAVCKGSSFIASVSPEDRSPFRLLISCPNDMVSGEIIAGFEQFYTSFFDNVIFDDCIAAFNACVKADENKLGQISCDVLFDMITDINHSDKKPQLIADVKKKLRVKYPEMGEFALIRLSIKTVENMFDDLKNKRSYFMMEE